jgi:hypothetical protein
MGIKLIQWFRLQSPCPNNKHVFASDDIAAQCTTAKTLSLPVFIPVRPMRNFPYLTERQGGRGAHVDRSNRLVTSRLRHHGQNVLN